MDALEQTRNIDSVAADSLREIRARAGQVIQFGRHPESIQLGRDVLWLLDNLRRGYEVSDVRVSGAASASGGAVRGRGSAVPGQVSSDGDTAEHSGTDSGGPARSYNQLKATFEGVLDVTRDRLRAADASAEQVEIAELALMDLFDYAALWVNQTSADEPHLDPFSGRF